MAVSARPMQPARANHALTPAQRVRWQLMAADAHAFIFGDGEPLLMTKDEHRSDAPEQPFPDLPYLRVLLDCLLVSGGFMEPDEARYALDWGIPLVHLRQQALTGTLFIEKSRQVMASWICCAYTLWRAKFHAHQLCIVQSRKEMDAVKFVFLKEPQQARISFMELMLPDWLREIGMFATGTVNHYKGSMSDNGHLYFRNGSHIWAVPQGGDMIRSNTPSLLFSDEAAFQPEFGLAYQAAMPALRGGGQGIFVSSAEPGDFAGLVEAQV